MSEYYLAICNRVSSGTVFKTPSTRSKFAWVHSDPLRVILEVGPKKTQLTIPASCFEELPNFLKGKSWVRIGATHGIAPSGSVDEFLQRYTGGTSVASYVIPIFEKVGFVEVSRKRPMLVRWKLK